MKSASLWEAYKGVSGNGDNSSNLAVLPGGYRFTDGTFANIGKSGCWWSSSEETTDWAWYRYLDYVAGNAVRGDNVMGSGFSVRCVRD